ncbi:hypothetical protein BRADI_4g32500v3 [Brachypodium distachyon]|uniref:USP domain-containing protein n=1 Tax=Brachypodium distachyon TaxID=15368 RepID=A0A2K2CRT4_BRADI|nr:hypothetical protein BRADI_4g32500v3 [Brachypodium distachyon]
MASLASLVAGVVALAVVTLATVVRHRGRRAAARREEDVRWLASIAAREFEIAEWQAYYYSAHHGASGRADDVAEAPWYWTAPEVASPWIEQEQQAVAEPMIPAAAEPMTPAAAEPMTPEAAGKAWGLCARCRRMTTRRCARCKIVKYCSMKCQVSHWRRVHKFECHVPSIDAKKDSTSATEGVECNSSYEQSVVAGVEPAVKISNSVATMPELSKENCDAKLLGNESKEMPFQEASNTAESPQVTGLTESADVLSFPTSGKDCKVQGASVSENGSQSQIPADNSSSQAHCSAGFESELEQSSKQAPCIDNIKSSRSLPPMSTTDKVPSTCAGANFPVRNPSKKTDSLPAMSVGSENEVVVPNNLSTDLIRQQTAPKILSHSPSESTLFPYELFTKLYNFDKVELRPFGLCNLGNSCYVNAVLQCLAFTRPLTAYLFEGLHSKKCSKKEWCFLCEFEKLIVEGKAGKSPLSPTGILSHLHDIGSSFGLGKEEDAHEFLRASMKEAEKNGVGKLAEETTLMQLMFGGFVRSQIKCTKCQVSSGQCERILDLTVEIDGDISTLEEALHQFTSTEVLDGDNKYHCSRCNSYERAKKKLTIYEAPNILTIALKRYQTGSSGKINKAISFPECLNLSSYMSTTNDYSPVYRLYAVVVHHDVQNAAFSGHYVCYVKDSHEKWHEMDDRQVKSVSLEKVLTKCAYMLFYARCSPRTPRSLRKVIIAQNPSRTKKTGQTLDPEITLRSSYLSRHQGGQLCRDHVLHNHTHILYTFSDSSHQVLVSPSPSRSSSLFSNSDSGSIGTFRSDSTDSTVSSNSMGQYDYIFGSSDQMYPLSTAVIPGEHERGTSQRSSDQYADQAGKVERLNKLNNQASIGVWDEGGTSRSFFYTDQGKHQGSRSTCSSSYSSSCSSSGKLIEHRSRRTVGEVLGRKARRANHFILLIQGAWVVEEDYLSCMNMPLQLTEGGSSYKQEVGGSIGRYL